MSWQAPHYDYPIPNTDSPVKSFVEGAQSGISTILGVMSIADKAKQLRRDKDVEMLMKDYEKKMEALKDEEPTMPDTSLSEKLAPSPVETPEQAAARSAGTPITDQLTGRTQEDFSKMAGTPMTDQLMGTAATTPEQKVASAVGTPITNQIKTAEYEKVKAEENKAMKEYIKQKKEYNLKRYALNAEMNNNIINAFYKNGFVKEGMAMKESFMGSVEKLAALDPDAATKVWNNSFLKDDYGPVKLTRKGDFELKIDRDGNRIIFNKTTAESYPVAKNVGDLIKLPEKGSLGIVTDNGISVVYKPGGEKRTPHITHFEAGGEKVVKNYVTDENGRVVEQQDLLSGPRETPSAKAGQERSDQQELRTMADKDLLSTLGKNKDAVTEEDKALTPDQVRSKYGQTPWAQNPNLKMSEYWNYTDKRAMEYRTAGYSLQDSYNNAKADAIKAAPGLVSSQGTPPVKVKQDGKEYYLYGDGKTAIPVVDKLTQAEKPAAQKKETAKSPPRKENKMVVPKSKEELQVKREEAAKTAGEKAAANQKAAMDKAIKRMGILQKTMNDPNATKAQRSTAAEELSRLKGMYGY